MDAFHGAARSVLDEYARLDEAKCDCGETGFTLERQYLMKTPAGPRDVLVAVCHSCHATRWFWFDISSFFEDGHDSQNSLQT